MSATMVACMAVEGSMLHIKLTIDGALCGQSTANSKGEVARYVNGHANRIAADVEVVHVESRKIAAYSLPGRKTLTWAGPYERLVRDQNSSYRSEPITLD